MSPTPGRSTLITSAPNQASNCVQVGPDWTWVKSRMRTPVSALVIIFARSEEHTSELQSLRHLVCRLLLEKKKKTNNKMTQAITIEQKTTSRNPHYTRDT